MYYARHGVGKGGFVFCSENIFTFQLTSYIYFFEGGLLCAEN